MTALERRYRQLLLAYPRGYRSAYGDELIGLLLDTADPGSSLPPPKEREIGLRVEREFGAVLG
ncbi:hypothetical protein FHR32_003058 [Streptosporangium album]|uniref:Uncharacterized protein n=1 Tax=Streptosporangium album TaxID=47479 RepID=A0A7W7RWA2_9ACTN|nr:hypothetical protein [Streptosporangium album]MBB4938753.1 hypothetical protein [Streptosporangium album]